MAPQKDNFGLRQALERRGLTSIMVFGNPDSPEGAQGYRPGQWDPTYDETRTAANEYLTGFKNSAFPDGVRNGGRFQVPGGGLNVITDVHVDIGEDGFPSVKSFSFSDPKGEEYTYHLDAQVEGQDEPQSIVTPRMKPGPSASSFAGNRKSTGPLHTELRGPMPDPGFLAKAAGEVRMAAGAVKDKIYDGAALLFGEKSGTIESKTLPSPPSWSEQQLRTFHDTGRLPSGASWDDVFYPKFTPITNEKGETIGYHQPGELRAPLEYKPWMRSETNVEEAFKRDGLIGGMFAMRNPYTLTKDIIHNLPMPGGNGKYDTIGNRAAGAIGLEQRLPGKGLPRIGEGNATPQQHLFQPQYIAPSDSGLATGLKGAYNVGTGVANVLYSIPEFMHSGTGYAVQGIGTKLQSAKAAIPQAMMQTGAASPQTAAAVNTARKWVAADTAAQGMFIKHMGEATIDAGKNVVEQIRQGDYANLTSSLPDLLASGIFTGQIIKHTAGNIPQLSHGGMHRVGVDAGMQQVVDSNMSAIDRNFAQTPDVVREADMRTAFGDVFNAEAYGPGGVPISPIVYGRNNAGVAGLPQQPITTANGQVIYQPQEGDLTSGSRLDLRNLAKPEGKPVELSPAAAKLMKEGEELTAKEAAERIQRSSADEAERARVLAELEKQGFTAEQKAKDDVELGDYLKRIDEERLKLFQETGHYYHPDELLAATSGGRAGGGPRPVEPGKGGAGRRPNSPVEIAAENKRRQDLINNGINPDTNQPMAKPGTLPADALTGPRGTATMAPDATAARPGLAPEGVTNIESQRNAAGTMDVPTARLPEVHSSMFSGPAGRNLIDVAAAELGLPKPSESVDTGFWSEGGVLQNNGASAFRFTLQPGSDMADAMRRVGRFATSLSAAHGQKGVGWSVIRHDIQPDVKGNYPDYKGENQMGTAIQVDAGRKLNRPEIIAFSKEVERILKADYNIDAAGSVGPMSHEGGVRMFDFMGSVPDKMALAEASRKAWENTIGRDSGHNATVRLIAYEGKYEQQEGWDSEFKPGTFGGRYGQVLGLGTDAGISPRLRRAIDAATRERNEQTKLYSGHGGKRGTQFHPQTGQPLDPTGSRVVATPLALTGDRQLSAPVRPVLPQSNAEQVPLTAGYGRSSPRLPGSSQSRAAIPAAEANQAARDVGRFRELDNPDARLGGGQTAAQAPLSRGLSETLRRTSTQGQNLTLEVLSENESLDGAVRGNNPGVPTRMNTVHLLLRSDKDIPVPPTQTGRPDYTGMSNLFRGEAGRRVATEIIGQIQTTKNGEPEVYIERFDTHPGMRNQGMLKGLLSEFVHRINNEAEAQGMTRMLYRLSDVSDLSASSKALAAIVGPENITINVRGIGDMPYTEWRKKFDSDVFRRAENERAEAKTFDDVLKAGEDFQAGRISEAERDAIFAAHYDASTRLEADSTLPYRSSRGASGYSMLGNRSLQGDSLENQIADHYQRIEEAKAKLERGEGNPNRIRAELDMLGDDLQDLLREQDRQAGLSTFDAKPAEAPAETSNVPRWEQPMPAHLRPGTPAYNREIMERHHAKMDSMKMSGNQARLLPPKAEVELMGLRRLMRDVSDGKVSTGEATEAIQRSIEKLVDRTSVSKERGLAELRNIQGIDQQFLDMAARKFDEREARKNQASQPAPQGGTTGRDRVRDPLAKPQVWERRQERTGPEALTETGDPSRLTYDELVDLQTRLEKNKGSADPDLLRSVTEEMQNRHRQYGNEGERNTALGGFVPETTPKSQLNDMVRSLPDQIRSDRERLSELNKRDGRNRSSEAAQLATEIKVNEERLRAAKVELNARGRQQGNWERLDRTRIVQRERDKQTFDNPDNPGPRVKRDPVQALNWARGRFDRLTIDELMQARDALKEQGRPYWREVEKAINERRKAMPEMRREEGRTTDIVPENMTRPELDAEVDRLSTEIEANDARVSEMQAAGASAAEIEAVRAEVDPQRGRLSEFQAEVENRDRIETTDFRRENEKQIGGHQQFRNEMAGRRKKLDIVSRVEGRENQPGQFFQEEARYYGLSAGARDVVNMTFRGNTKVKDVLERIVKNSKSKDKQGIDPELGKLAEYLLKNQDAKSLEVVVGAWGKNSGEASGYMAGWRPEAGNIQGGNKYGGIKFSKEQLSNPKHALEIVMHEIVHSATADKVNRAIFGTVGVITGDTGIDVVGSSGTKYLDRLRAYAQSSGSDKAVRRLVQTYLKVLSEQKDNSKPLSVDKLNNLKDDPRNATRNIFGAGSDMNRLAAAGQYPIADLNEFIAHASTNAEFKAYLKTIKMGETNAWSKFKQAVKEIMGIEGGTALDVAMESILEISAKNISDFKKPDGEYYSQLFDIRSQRKQAEGMSPSDADAATAAEIHPRGFDEFGVGKQSLTRGIKDAEADIEELTNRTKGRQMTREETREMNDLLQEHEGYKEAYEQKFENNKDFLQAKKDLEAELGREATHDEVIQEMDFRETMSEPGEYNYRQFERDRKRETRGKSEQELMDRLREEPGMEGKLPKEEPLDPDFEAELAKEAATSMGLEKDTLEALGIITRDERRSSGEFAPGSFERRDELYQGFVELGGDTDVRSSSEIPADVQRAFKERYGFEYKPEDVDTLGEPRLGNKDIKGLEGGTNGFRMSSNKSFLREEAQASINVVKKGIEGLKRAKENITDKETFLQHGVDFATASFLRSSQAQLDVLADRRQSKVIREVSELLNSTLAGRTDKAAKIGFHTAVSRSQLQFKNELADALRPFESELKLKDVDGQKQFLEDLGRAMVQPGLPSDPKLAQAVTSLRGLYRKMHQYQIRAGIKLDNAGETYVPRMLNNEMVLKDRYGFLNAAQKAYETTGMDPIEAREAASEWYDAILRGDSGFSFDQKFVFDSSNLNGEPKHTRSRKFNKVAEGFMEKYYNRNILDATTSYIGRAVKNAEIARRFGAEFEVYQGLQKALISEGNRTALQEMNSLVANQLGTNQLKDYKGQGIINFLNAYSAIHFLPRATLSSIGEPLVTGLRTGNVVDSLSAMGNSLVYMKRKLLKDDPDYYHKLAQDVGVVVSELSGQAVSSSVDSRYWTDQTRSSSKYLTDQFFRKTGLHQWTEGTRIASVRAGTVFLRRLAEDINDNGRMKASSARYLNELGVTDHASFAKFVKQLEKLDDAGKLALISRQNGKGPQMYRDALARFAEQVIMNPNAGTRPRWANHPLGSVIFNLQSYLYAFHENVTKRALRLAKTAVSKNELTAMDRMHMLGPAMMLPVLTGVQYLMGEARDEAFKDPARVNEAKMSEGMKIARAMSRSNLFGRFDFMANAALSARYDKDPATVMLGPVLGTFSEGIKGGVDYLGPRNSKNTNTAERRFARLGYDLAVQPAANAAFALGPGKIMGGMGAIGIQATSHPATREYVVKGLAGKPAKPQKRNDEEDDNIIDELLK